MTVNTHSTTVLCALYCTEGAYRFYYSWAAKGTNQVKKWQRVNCVETNFVEFLIKYTSIKVYHRIFVVCWQSVFITFDCITSVKLTLTRQNWARHHQAARRPDMFPSSCLEKKFNCRLFYVCLTCVILKMCWSELSSSHCFTTKEATCEPDHTHQEYVHEIAFEVNLRVTIWILFVTEVLLTEHLTLDVNVCHWKKNQQADARNA